MAMKVYLPDTTRLWGILDLCALAWYLGWRLFHGQVPFHHDIAQSIATAKSLGLSVPIYTASISLVLYLSLAVSGVLLFKRHSLGAILTYLQVPFRLLTFIPPSLFFILWPLKYVFTSPPVILGAALVVGSEVLKVSTVVCWRRSLGKSYNKALQTDAFRRG